MLPIDGLQKTFGRVVRQRRLSLGLSQEELADRCKLHRTYISLIERGLKSASLKAITLIASALETKPHELIKDAETLLNG